MKVIIVEVVGECFRRRPLGRYPRTPSGPRPLASLVESLNLLLVFVSLTNSCSLMILVLILVITVIPVRSFDVDLIDVVTC